MTSALLGTYKTEVYADTNGHPRVGTLRVPLAEAGHGMVGAEYRINVAALTPDVVYHTDRHDGCPQTHYLDVRTADRTLVGQLTCCATCRP